MKRLIHGSEAIFGMAYERQKAYTILKNNSDTLSVHIIKCLVYGNSTGNYKHWVEDEICDYIGKANCVYLKPNNRKPKKEDFIRTLFASFGDAMEDAKLNLGLFQTDNRLRRLDRQYPTFDITDELVDRLYTAYQNLIHAMIPILTTKNDYSKEDWVPIIYEAIDV